MQTGDKEFNGHEKKLVEEPKLLSLLTNCYAVVLIWVYRIRFWDRPEKEAMM